MCDHSGESAHVPAPVQGGVGVLGTLVQFLSTVQIK